MEETYGRPLWKLTIPFYVTTKTSDHQPVWLRTFDETSEDEGPRARLPPWVYCNEGFEGLVLFAYMTTCWNNAAVRGLCPHADLDLAQHFSLQVTTIRELPWNREMYTTLS